MHCDREARAMIAHLWKRVTALELASGGKAPDEANLKSQAAAAQATQDLPRPIRNDTRAIIDLGNFVRRIAQWEHGFDVPMYIVLDAQALLRDLEQ